MPYTATVYNVLIACNPSTYEQRLIAEELIAEWNGTHAHPTGVVLVVRNESSLSESTLCETDLLVLLVNPFDSEQIEEYLQLAENHQKNETKSSDQQVTDSLVYFVAETLSDEEAEVFEIELMASVTADSFDHVFEKQLCKITDKYVDLARTEGGRDFSEGPAGIEQLTEPMQKLLQNMYQESSQMVWVVGYLGGVTIEIGGENQIDVDDPTSVASVKESLAKLHALAFISSVNPEKTIFTLSKTGVEVVESLLASERSEES